MTNPIITCANCAAPHTPPSDRERSDICDDCHGRLLAAQQSARKAAYPGQTRTVSDMNWAESLLHASTQERASAPAKAKGGRVIQDDEPID